jgi:hypothetical protein
MRRLLDGLRPLSATLGPIVLAGSDWERRPDWAVQLGIQGVDVDPDVLEGARAQPRPPVPFQDMIDFMGQGRFAPIVQRPLFNELAFVTNRTFATFCADTIPLVVLPKELAQSIYGPRAEPLHIGEDVTDHVSRILRDPAPYWRAVLDTRKYLAEHHTFHHRFKELLEVLEGNASGPSS